MHPVALSAALLLLAPLAETDPAQRTITKTEIRRDSPHRTHVRLRDTIWDMFEQQDMRRRTPPRYPLRDVWLTTRPRATEVPSLCRFDSVRFEFAPAGPKAGASTEVQAVGLEVNHNFHFQSPPAGGYHSVVRDGIEATDGSCGSLSIDKTPFLTAAGAEVATDAYRALLNLQDALRGGRAVPLECELFPVDAGSCTDIILKLGQGDFSTLYACDQEEQPRPCFVADSFVRRVTIAVARGDRDLNVVSARLESMITIADQRVD